MNKKHSDLIAIANSDLAEKLDRLHQAEPARSDVNETQHLSETQQGTFKQYIWKAVYTLNLIRYLLGLGLLLFVIAPNMDSSLNMTEVTQHPKLFITSTLLILLSAVLFSYVSKYKEVEFNILVTAQFSLDVVLAALLTHCTGSIESNFALLYLAVVATGSVVLPRVQALGLAGGAIILLFFEHFYSLIAASTEGQLNYPLLVKYSVLLFAVSWLISYLAQRIRIAELKRFVPGDQNIEDFLIREEKHALQAALKQTNNNKTEAAKLLGMSFRSFRYKLTKYEIG